MTNSFKSISFLVLFSLFIFLNEAKATRSAYLHGGDEGERRPASTVPPPENLRFTEFKVEAIGGRKFCAILSNKGTNYKANFSLDIEHCGVLRFTQNAWPYNGFSVSIPIDLFSGLSRPSPENVSMLLKARLASLRYLSGARL